ncbi:MAG: FAD-binding protein, partial [Nitrospirae bacterium]|nr:FAD-binding protein [Nitrospirota bacterium]
MMTAPEIPSVSGELRENEPMSRHTSWRVGGPAELFFRPADLEDLSLFLRGLDAETPVFWLGLGSNLLVRDGGIPGVVIAAAGVFKDLERVADLQVRAGVSLPCTQLARQCVRWGIGPSEFFAGIPGTVGGALAMNAGAHGGETWERWDFGSDYYIGSGLFADITIDPTDPNIVYVPLFDGIAKSTDRGISWTKLATGYIWQWALRVQPDNSQVLYLATLVNGVFKSEDGGENWRAVGLQGQRVNALEIDPKNPNILYAATPDEGIYK